MTDFAFTLEEDVPANPTTGAVEGTYTHNPAHVAEMQDHLIEFFKNGPRNQAVLAAIGQQVQELEDALWALFGAFDVDTATGDQLLLLGKLVGEPEAGRSTEDFRAAINARILINQSDGKLEQMLEIAQLLFPTALYVLAYETPPMSLTLEFVGELGALSHANINRLLKQAKAGGVRLDTVVNPDPSAGFFWSPESAPSTNGAGWGKDTDLTTGGDWSEVL